MEDAEKPELLAGAARRDRVCGPHEAAVPTGVLRVRASGTQWTGVRVDIKWKRAAREERRTERFAEKFAARLRAKEALLALAKRSAQRGVFHGWWQERQGSSASSGARSSAPSERTETTA